MQDSKRLSAMTSFGLKEGIISAVGGLIVSKNIQLPQETCIAQSDSSIWCILEEAILGAKTDMIKTRMTATKIFFLFTTIVNL